MISYACLTRGSHILVTARHTARAHPRSDRPATRGATAPPGRGGGPARTVLAATARVVVRSSTCRTWRDGTRVQSDLVPIINKNADRVSATHTIPRYRSTMTQNIRHNSYRFGPQQSQWLVPRASVYTMRGARPRGGPFHDRLPRGVPAERARARAIVHRSGRARRSGLWDGGRLPRGACNAIGITSPLSFQTLRVRARASGP